MTSPYADTGDNYYSRAAPKDGSKSRSKKKLGASQSASDFMVRVHKQSAAKEYESFK